MMRFTGTPSPPPLAPRRSQLRAVEVEVEAKLVLAEPGLEVADEVPPVS